MTNIISYISTLTYDELEDWAGEKIFTRGKSLVNKVRQLERRGENVLIAQVKGTELYDCSVVLEDGELESDCTCPYYDRCKHVVAVVLAAAKAIKAEQGIPLAEPNNTSSTEPLAEFFSESSAELSSLDKTKRHMLEQIQQKMAEAGLSLEQVDALTCAKTEQPIEYDPDEYLGDMTEVERNKRLSTAFNALSKAKLVQLLMELARDNPETLLYDLLERASLLSRKTPASKSQISALRRRIKKITAEESWQDHWLRTGHTPDYSPIVRGFNQLIEHGQFDEVIELSKEMWPLALEQINHSDDEGELIFEVSQAMIPVMAVLPKSSMKPAIQILWLMDLELEDEYGLLQDTDLVYNDQYYVSSVWRDVSTVLENRLNNKRLGKASLDWSERFDYCREVSQLLFSLEKQGDVDAVIRVQIAYITQTRDYTKLVDNLLKLGRREEAEQWLVMGYQQVVGQERGTASALKDRLCDMLMADGNYHAVAALIADDFFATPRLDDYKKVEQACKSLDIWPQVRLAILAFLESDKLPDPDFDTDLWPLPMPRLTQLNYNGNIKKKPVSDRLANYARMSKKTLMLEIALYEERISEAVALYQRYSDDIYVGEEFAHKVAPDYPDIAAKLYLEWTEQEINKANKEAYQAAGKQLRKMRTVLESHGRLPEWQQCIAKLQKEHKRKIRLMEVLERLLIPSKKLVD